MEVRCSKYIGFCDGVTRSITTTEKLLENSDKVYALGDLVHNDFIINKLKDKGLIIVDSLPNKECDVIIRAHGTTKETYGEAKNKGIKITDLTCPKVLSIHMLAQKLKDDDYFIILIGKKTHPEVIGTISFCGEKSIIIENTSDIDSLIIDSEKLAIIVQTTFSLEKFNNLANIIKEKYSNKKIKIYNTICNSTKERQEEVKELSKSNEAILIVGDKKSSNTNKLYELAKDINSNTFFIYFPISINCCFFN